MKDDERIFLLAVYDNCKTVSADGLFPRDIIHLVDMNHKRCWYLLEKWTGKDWYSYGVSLDLGWLTEKGISIAEEIKSH